MIDSFGSISSDQLRDMALQGNGSLESRLQNLKKNGDDAAIKKFSQEFEEIFVQRLLKEMRKSIPKGGLMDKSLSMEWFEGMFDQAVTKDISAGEGIGLAKIIYEQLTRSPGFGPAGSAPPRPGQNSPAEDSENSKDASGHNPLEQPQNNGGAYE